MNDNMELWNKVSKPPPEALKQITGGRLSGMTDIKPQWRVQALTEALGACGDGWQFTIERLWTEPGSEGQVMAFAHVSLFARLHDTYSDAIPGIGGSMLIAKESKGLHSSDEAFKMAVTDALGSAMKMLGVAAEVYMGNWTGSKYKDENPKSDPKPTDNRGKIDTLVREYTGAIMEITALPHLKNHMAKHLPEFEKALKDCGASEAQMKWACGKLEGVRQTTENSIKKNFDNTPPPEDTTQEEW